MLENFKKNAGEDFAAELDILTADMRSSSYEAALTRFEARFNSPMTIEVTVSGPGSTAKTTLNVKIVDLDKNSPPNPVADDRNDSFSRVAVPNRTVKNTASWGVWRPCSPAATSCGATVTISRWGCTLKLRKRSESESRFAG